MEKFIEYRDKARSNIRIADHMLTMTYPLVKDPKILLAVLENIFMALTNAMASVLHYERAFKRIPPFNDTFNSKYSLFKAKVVTRYSIDLSVVRFIAEMKELVQDHKNSTTEFARKGSYVMADENYRLRTVGEKEMKKYLEQAKTITHELLQLVSKNDAMYGRREGRA